MSQSVFDSTELPFLASHTHCVLIPRDPNFIFAYWDYTQQDIDRAQGELGVEGENARLILRIYDITGVDFNGLNANHTWDLDVGYSTKNWYVHVWQDNADYCAQLGVSSGFNLFVPIGQSNRAHTPPKSASHRNDLIWQDIHAKQGAQTYIEEDVKGRSHRTKSLIHQLSPKELQKGKPSSKTKLYYLTAQDIREYYMSLFARVSRRARRKLKTLSMEDILKRKLKGVAWKKVRPRFTYPDILKRAYPGSSMGASENSGGASESLSGLKAGGGSEERLKSRKFFFEIWSELIVYGRTETDAIVLLNQKGVKLNPDGTFSVRYSLPDGGIPFEFIAQSSDGVEERHILTRVEREKTRSSVKLLKDFHG
ncbi:MAG: DUF4912 domain-containing protein [Candidatus Omnitrophica bacterium]|nr:DUF4912 domain-containing protein [Candidatus Omnitrophota bacterium]